MPLLQTDDGPPLVALTANFLDPETVQVVAERLVRLAKESGEDSLHLDLGGVDFVTAADLGSLVNLRNHLSSNGVTLTLRNVKSRVYEVIKMTGLTKLLNARLKQPALRVEGAGAVLALATAAADGTPDGAAS